MRTLLVAMTVLAVAGVAGATVTITDLTFTADVLPGVWAVDIELTSDADWLATDLIVEGVRGTVTNGTPDFLFPGVNDVDTWVNSPSVNPFDTSVVATPLTGTQVLFITGYDTVSTGPATWQVARVLLSNDAVGTITLQSFDASDPNNTQVAVIDVPEPATLALLGLGAVGALVRRRR